MHPGVLVSVMALVAIVCVYFWLVRKRDEGQATGVNAGPEQK